MTPCPLAPAALTAFQRVDTVKADTLAGDLDHIAIDDAGRAGDVGKGEGGEEREQEGRAEHDRGVYQSEDGLMRWRQSAECRLSLGSCPVYPQDLP